MSHARVLISCTAGNCTRQGESTSRSSPISAKGIYGRIWVEGRQRSHAVCWGQQCSYHVVVVPRACVFLAPALSLLQFGGASSGSRYDRMLETAAVERAPARSSAPARTSSRAASSSRRAKRGMKLGSKKGKKADSMLQSLMKEEHIPTGAGSGAAAGAAVVEEAKAGPGMPLHTRMLVFASLMLVLCSC